jgi:hypothetical protein
VGDVVAFEALRHASDRAALMDELYELVHALAPQPAAWRVGE